MLNSILLQINLDANTLLGIGAIITSVISVIMVILTIGQYNKTKYLEFIKDVDLEISQQLEKETNLKDRNDCIIYAYNYIDICDRVLFLLKKGKISKTFYEYYRDFFSYAATMMWWYITIYPQDEHSIKNSWSSLTYWIVNENIEAYPAFHLPEAMKNEIGKKKSQMKGAELCIELIEKIKSIQSKN